MPSQAGLLDFGASDSPMWKYLDDGTDKAQQYKDMTVKFDRAFRDKLQYEPNVLLSVSNYHGNDMTKFHMQITKKDRAGFTVRVIGGRYHDKNYSNAYDIKQLEIMWMAVSKEYKD